MAKLIYLKLKEGGNSGRGITKQITKQTTKQVVAPIIKYSIADLKAVSLKFLDVIQKSLTELFMVSLYRFTELGNEKFNQ